jgi:signal transduction histidine kinase
MVKLKIKLALFNLFSKLAFTALFLILMPYVIQRINLTQVDKTLIRQREEVLNLISSIGIEPFITSDSISSFGSYNILKEEYISIERYESAEDVNYIDVSRRLIEGDEIEYRVLYYSFGVDGGKYLLEVGKSLTSIQQTRRSMSRVMIVFLGCIILITFLTDFEYTRLLLKPFSRITGKLKGISDPSIFDKNPVITTTSDFKSLDNALIELMEHIDELFKKEKEITVNISHELLTPVSVLRSKLENLLLNKNLSPDISTKLEESLKTLLRLQSMVNSLLLIARIESHQYLREDSFNIRVLLEEIGEELDPIAEDAGLKITLNPGGDLLYKNANRSLIYSMFYNIINNAIKNTDKGGNILIECSSVNDRISVIISDTGRGMTKEQLDTIFSRFKTMSAVNGNGTGIGLAIAKTIADFHQIKVTVESEPGKGTKFFFLFP